MEDGIHWGQHLANGFFFFFLSWDIVETLGEAKVNQHTHSYHDLSE